MKKFKSNLVGIVILLLGVIVGVFLIGQTTSFKNSAMVKVENKYKICHKTGDIDKPWEELEVNSEELSTYLNNGDIFGECPQELLQ